MKFHFCFCKLTFITLNPKLTHRMAYGPDTEELLNCIANITNNELHLDDLNITSLPELPNDLKVLDCSNTKIKVLPELLIDILLYNLLIWQFKLQALMHYLNSYKNKNITVLYYVL